ncbi:MAG: FecR family protein [Methylobacter sp.]|nr:FecR family protein [Methylobacter sp.]
MPLDTDEELGLPELKQQAIEWLILLRTQDISEVETEAFANWLSEDIAHADAFARAETLFQDMTTAALSPKVANPVKPVPSKPDIKRLAVNTNKQALLSVSLTRWLALPFALAAVWLFIVVLVLPKQSNYLNDYFSDYHTGTGELKNIQLADGSHILLNTNTAVSVDYQDSLRRITLHHGQAQFTVAKDKQRPFEVQSEGLITRALGTIFEVYRHESGDINVTVQEHAVAVISPGKSPVEVRERQWLRYHNGSLAEPETIDTLETGAWQQRRLLINDRPIAELIEELNRYRIGRIFLSDKQLNNLRVSGMFSLADPDEALNKVLKILSLQETRLGPLWVVLHR